MLRDYGWGATSDYLFKIGDIAPTGSGWLESSGRRGRPINHSSSQKTRLNNLAYGITIWTDSFRFVTIIHAFDRRTDRILIARSRLHSMQRGKNSVFVCCKFSHWMQWDVSGSREFPVRIPRSQLLQASCHCHSEFFTQSRKFPQPNDHRRQILMSIAMSTSCSVA